MVTLIHVCWSAAPFCSDLRCCPNASIPYNKGLLSRCLPLLSVCVNVLGLHDYLALPIPLPMVLPPLPLRSPAMLSSRLAQRLLSSLSDDALVDSSWWPVSLVPLADTLTFSWRRTSAVLPRGNRWSSMCLVMPLQHSLHALSLRQH